MIFVVRLLKPTCAALCASRRRRFKGSAGFLLLKDLPGTGGYTKTIDGKGVVFPARLARKGVVFELNPEFDAFIQVAQGGDRLT